MDGVLSPDEMPLVDSLASTKKRKRTSDQQQQRQQRPRVSSGEFSINRSRSKCFFCDFWSESIGAFSAHLVERHIDKMLPVIILHKINPSPTRNRGTRQAMNNDQQWTIRNPGHQKDYNHRSSPSSGYNECETSKARVVDSDLVVHRENHEKVDRLQKKKERGKEGIEWKENKEERRGQMGKHEVERKKTEKRSRGDEMFERRKTCKSLLSKEESIKGVYVPKRRRRLFNEQLTVEYFPSSEDSSESSLKEKKDKEQLDVSFTTDSEDTGNKEDVINGIVKNIIPETDTEDADHLITRIETDAEKENGREISQVGPSNEDSEEKESDVDGSDLTDTESEETGENVENSLPNAIPMPKDETRTAVTAPVDKLHQNKESEPRFSPESHDIKGNKPRLPEIITNEQESGPGGQTIDVTEHESNVKTDRCDETKVVQNRNQDSSNEIHEKCCNIQRGSDVKGRGSNTNKDQESRGSDKAIKDSNTEKQDPNSIRTHLVTYNAGNVQYCFKKKKSIDRDLFDVSKAESLLSKLEESKDVCERELGKVVDEIKNIDMERKLLETKLRENAAKKESGDSKISELKTKLIKVETQIGALVNVIEANKKLNATLNDDDDDDDNEENRSIS